LGAPPAKFKWLRFALAMLLSVAILLGLCWKTGTKLSQVVGKLGEVDLFLLGLTFALSAAVHTLLGALKWFLTLRWSGCATTFVETLFVRMGSDPLRAVLPFKSGELGNVAYYWRTGRLTFGESVSWVAFDKAMNIGGTFFWLIVGLVVLAFQRMPDALRSQSSVVVSGSLLVAASVGASFAPLVSRRVRRGLVALAGRISPKVGRFGANVLAVFDRISPRRKAALTILGVVFQLRPIVVCALLFLAFAPDFQRRPSPAEFLASGSVVVAFSNVPGPQWGTGPREFALNLLFRSYLKPEAAQETMPPPTVLGVAAENTARGRAVPGAQTLIAIGLLMAVAIHFVPAFVGLPFLVQFLNALRIGRPPPLNGPNDARSNNAKAGAP